MKNPNILTRSSYTFFNSLLKIDDIISLSISNGFSNVFLIDKNVMYGTMEFYKKAIAKNLKPIIGLEVETENVKAILIAKNNDGYKELLKISSMIQSDQEFNIESDNLIKFDSLIEPVCYGEKNERKTLEDFHKAGRGEDISFSSTHFLNREEFSSLYGEQVLLLIEKIIDEVNIEIKEQKGVLPRFKIDGQAIDSNAYLKELLENSIKQYLKENNNLDKKLYVDRVKYELEVIEKMGFESYFLIVADIVKWSKENNILVGPGRGSAPGSLISFLLKITTIDPIKNNLLFERFLNPERVTMPDIDLDFEDSKRDEVIEYIVNRWGKENVAQIITFQTLRAKMAFKDIARLKGISASEQNTITKLIPEDMTLEQAYNDSKSFKEKINTSELLQEVYHTAKLIEGLPRQFSTHAAGVVLSDSPIHESVPVQKGYGHILQTQYSMDHMEYNGLLKIDILGLRNLSFIKETLKSIKQNKNQDINLDSLELNDPKVYAMLASGKTSGVFQLESPGMKTSLREIKVTTFEDVVATTSLFRPGPMKMIKDFALRKNGKEEVKYIDDKSKEILEPTYGIIVYQEQIMKLVQVFSNFTLAKADILRRAIGKKDIKLLESLKEEFFIGARANGYSEEVIKETYELIYKFSDYGFNRSHAYAYTTISYWLAWLKINFPLEFMNSLLNSVINDTTKTPAYISETQDMGINIIAPSILKSRGNYTIIGNDIYVGLKTIKGIGETAIKSIEYIQDNFDLNISFIDFLIIATQNKLTPSIIELLIKSGSLSNFGFNKQTMLDNLEDIYKYLEMIKIVDGDNISFNKSIVPEKRINITEESDDSGYFNEVMGFSMGTTKEMEELISMSSNLNIEVDDLSELYQDKKVTIIAEIVSVRTLVTKTGMNMAFGQITNGKRKIDVVLWPAVFEKYSADFKPTTQAVFYCTVDLKRGEQFVINKMEVISNEG